MSDTLDASAPAASPLPTAAAAPVQPDSTSSATSAPQEPSPAVNSNDTASHDVNTATVNSASVSGNVPVEQISDVPAADIPQPGASLGQEIPAAPAASEDPAVALNHTATVDAPLSDVREESEPEAKPTAGTDAEAKPEAAVVPSEQPIETGSPESRPVETTTTAAPSDSAPVSAPALAETMTATEESTEATASSAPVETVTENQPDVAMEDVAATSAITDSPAPPADAPSTTKHELNDGAEPSAKRARVESPSVSFDPATVDPSRRMAFNRQKYSQAVLRQLKKSKDAGPFNQPVDPVKLNIPQYPTIITKPMDLGTIDRKLSKGEYATIDGFIEDVELVWTNCVKFNGPDSVISQMAMRVKEQFERQMRSLPEPEDKPVSATSKGGRVSAVGTPQGTPQSRPRKNSSPATQNGVPIIRRESVGVDGRPKREIHAPPPKSLPYSNQPARSKKNAMQLKFCESVIRELFKKQHESFAFPFYQPVDHVALGIPEYPKIVTEPMDLGTVQTKLKAAEYGTADEFEHDVRQVFRNCYKFNPAGSPVNVMGKRLESVFNEKWAEKPVPVARTSTSQYSDSDGESDEDDKNETVQMLHKQLEAMKNQIADLSQKKSSKGKKKGSGSGHSRRHSQIDDDDDFHRRGGSAKKRKHGGSSANAGASAPAADEVDESPMLPTFEQKTALSTRMGYMTEHQMPVVISILKRTDPNFDPEDEEVELDVDKIHPKTIRLLWNWIMEGIEPSFLRAAHSKKGQKHKKNRAILTEDEQQRQIAELEKELHRMKNGGGGVTSGLVGTAGPSDLAGANQRNDRYGGGGGNNGHRRGGSADDDEDDDEDDDDAGDSDSSEDDD
ncbi:transcription initiation at TATA-containing promoter protein [Savitreella phatthalungensis]